jgi:hypothetical protein
VEYAVESLLEQADELHILEGVQRRRLELALKKLDDIRQKAGRNLNKVSLKQVHHKVLDVSPLYLLALMLPESFQSLN